MSQQSIRWSLQDHTLDFSGYHTLTQFLAWLTAFMRGFPPRALKSVVFMRAGRLTAAARHDLPTVGYSQSEPGLKREGGCRRDGHRRK
ncbi:hypothetical protein ACVIGB_006816 [Bradyrhizobium sp. USDA 4341]